MPTCPTFDAWSIVFLIAAVQGFFIAFILFRWRRGDRQASRLLALVMLLFSLTMLEYVLFWAQCWQQFPHVAELSSQFPFLFGPLLWLYLRTIYLGKKISRSDWLHFAPFALAVVLLLPWYTLDAGSKQAVFRGEGGFPVSPSIVRALIFSRIAHMAAYAVWNAVFISKQPRVGATTRWAWTLDGFFIGFFLAYTSYFILSWTKLLNPLWDYQVSAAMTAFIYLIAYAGYVQPAVFEGYRWTEPGAPVKYRNSGLTPEASRSLLQNLNLLMDQEKAYHDPDISLEKLANTLNASKHHVSQVINEHLGASFFEYVNQLRVEEAKQLLSETTRSDLHIIEVAYAVGFNNKVSFNAAFKKATGMTPTEYRRSHGQTDPEGGAPGIAVGGGQ